MPIEHHEPVTCVTFSLDEAAQISASRANFRRRILSRRMLVRRAFGPRRTPNQRTRVERLLRLARVAIGTLLYFNEQHYHLIPTAALSEAQRDHLRATLEASGMRRL